MITITPDSAIQALRDVVAEAGPDYVYTKRPAPPSTLGNDSKYGAKCFYVHADGQAGCLIGRALVKLGLPVADLNDAQTRHGSVGINTFLGNLLDDRLVAFPSHKTLVPQYRVSRIFSAAQHAQDGGETWGAALAKAEEAFAVKA